MKIEKKQSLLFLLLVLGGILIRLIDFPRIPFSLFADEVDIGYQAMSFRETGKDYFGNFLPLQFHSFSDVRTSLPIYATILVSYIPGVSLELAIRLTPLFFAFGSLILIYFFINALFDQFKFEKGKGILQPGHFAVLILAVAPWHFTYSRTAFELSQLFFFNLLGFYLFLKYQKDLKIRTLVLSLLTLGLTPMIYSTAKLAILGCPLILWFFSDEKTRKPLIQKWYYCLLLFIPLIAVVISGGASQRFSEISVFTDPTDVTEINNLRQLDLGYKNVVGSSPGFMTKLVHNKITYIGSRFINNLVSPLSASFLFVTGDPNLRQAVPNWGMLLKSLLIPLVLGLFILFNHFSKNLTFALLVMVVLAIIPSALTRNGGDHGSRLFMLLLPLVIIISFGWNYLGRYKLFATTMLLITLVELGFFLHDYVKHYPYEADLSFHYGLKELVQKSKEEKKITIISGKYEPPLIFYLFYNHFSPAKFQLLMQNKKLYHDIDKNLNLEGYQLGDEPVYIAFVGNQNAKDLYPLKGVYYITWLEAVAIYHDQQKSMIPAIESPSGLPLYYRIEVD